MKKVLKLAALLIVPLQLTAGDHLQLPLSTYRASTPRTPSVSAAIAAIVTSAPFTGSPSTSSSSASPSGSQPLAALPIASSSAALAAALPGSVPVVRNKEHRASWEARNAPLIGIHLVDTTNPARMQKKDGRRLLNSMDFGRTWQDVDNNAYTLMGHPIVNPPLPPAPRRRAQPGNPLQHREFLETTSGYIRNCLYDPQTGQVELTTCITINGKNNRYFRVKSTNEISTNGYRIFKDQNGIKREVRGALLPLKSEAAEKCHAAMAITAACTQASAPVKK